MLQTVAGLSLRRRILRAQDTAARCPSNQGQQWLACLGTLISRLVPQGARLAPFCLLLATVMLVLVAPSRLTELALAALWLLLVVWAVSVVLWTSWVPVFLCRVPMQFMRKVDLPLLALVVTRLSVPDHVVLSRW